VPVGKPGRDRDPDERDRAVEDLALQVPVVGAR
jgi:hypothetical protein